MTAPTAASDAPAERSVAGAAASTPNGVRLVRMRPGRANEVLFLVPGLEGDPEELAALVAALTGPQEVYVVAPLPEDAHGQPVVGMERMAELMVAAIRELHPSGAYRLGGYSFGALLALEMAQQLRAAGEVVEALVLIEAVYDERYWPRGIWLRALLRRTGRQLLRIVRMRPGKAIAEFRMRGVRLVQRLLRRQADAPDLLRATDSDEASMLSRAYAAISGYRPRFYNGPMTLVASSIDRHFGCDTVRLWDGYAAHLEIERIDGDHLTVMHDAESAAAVAGVIDHQLARERPNWAGVRPAPGFERPLILTTMRWFASARLADAMVKAGFTVSACRPGGHLLAQVDAVTGSYRLNRLWRLRSLLTAIDAANPDIILPDDERALVLLRRLYARTPATDTQRMALLARSLGNVEDWPLIVSRTGLANEAQRMDIPVPATAVIDSAAALATWVGEHGLPIVLKTDGSWGGRGVAVVRRSDQLAAAWHAVSSPPRLARAVKRMVVDREAGPVLAWARRVRPVVNAQQFVAGREAIATVACLDGTVQTLVCLEVVQASQVRGPAAVVRIIDHPEMARAARQLVERFGLSGFCGFDFMIDESGAAHLLELNPRVTPTCHLLVEGDHQRTRTIALFPPVAVEGAVDSAVLDLPLRAPSLIRAGERLVARRQRPTARFIRRLKQKVAGARS